MSMRTGIRAFAVLATAFCSLARADFQLQEATIDDIHKAIRSGEMTCKQVVEAYVARAKTYNVAACSKLVTPDGAKVPKLWRIATSTLIAASAAERIPRAS